jgi:hypothetical protein
MPDELEPRLERALSALPGPDDAVAERAARAALAALPEPAAGSRTWHLPVLLVAVAAAVLGAAVGVTLAATGTAPFAPDRPAPATRPASTNHTAGSPRRPAPLSGVVATYADGRLWLGNVHGRPFSAVELSPGALYVAVGEGHRLSVYTPDLRRRVWSHRVAGPVVAIAWRPLGTQIAYVVHHGHRNVLHLIQADGDTDQVVDPAVAPVTPSWRWDSQAFAYVGAGGHVAVRDLVHLRTDVVRLPRWCPTGGAQSVAFAPAGPKRGWIAGALLDGNAFAVDTATGRATCFAAPPATVGADTPPLVGWTPRGELLAAHQQFVARLTIQRGRMTLAGYTAAAGWVAGMAPAPSGGAVLLAVIRSDRLREVVAALPPHADRGAVRVLPPLPPLLAGGHPPVRVTLFWR